MIIRILKTWLPFAFVTTAICGIIYLAVQQNYRQSAYDPQISIAEDMKLSFDSATPTKILDTFPQNVNISTSLSPFVILYSGKGIAVHALSGTVAFQAKANETEYDLPNGVFDWVGNHGEDRITWQPQNGVRIAAVIVPLKNGDFILVGRNMREIEKRIEILTLQVSAGWMTTMVVSLILIGVLEFVSPKKK